MSHENLEIARQAFDAFNRTFTKGAPDLYEPLDLEVVVRLQTFTDRKQALETARLSK